MTSERPALYEMLDEAACVAGWSLWTVTFGNYGTPPNVDDGLRWYLVGTGVIVASATVVEAWRRGLRQQLSMRRAAGALVWMIGVTATFAIPVVGYEQVPPRDAILPLPPGMAVVHEEAGCAKPKQFHPRNCWRRLTVAATDNAQVRDLARRLGQHLKRTKGWRVTYGLGPDPYIECRPVSWLANPYRLCAALELSTTALRPRAMPLLIRGPANRNPWWTFGLDALIRTTPFPDFLSTIGCRAAGWLDGPGRCRGGSAWGRCGRAMEHDSPTTLFFLACEYLIAT